MFLRLFVLWKMYMLKVAVKITMALKLLNIFNMLRSNMVSWCQKYSISKKT